MANSHTEDLIINKITLLNDFSIEYIENKINKLTPAGKYQVYLLTTAIIFHRLKAINAFNLSRINTDSLTYLVIETASQKFYEYKNIHDKVQNTFKHNSAIIEGTINRENRNFFRNDLPELRTKSIKTIMEFNNDINSGLSFSNVYINLFIFPFFNTNTPFNELNSEKRLFINIINQIDYFELDDFKAKISNLINTISNKLNEDSYFMSNLSGKSTGNKNCYIATLVYKDIEHPKVEILRNYRDNILSKYFLGKLFIKFYYKFSPKLVKNLERYSSVHNIIRFFLDTIIKKISNNN